MPVPPFAPPWTRTLGSLVPRMINVNLENFSLKLGSIHISVLEGMQEPASELATVGPGEAWGCNLKPNLPLTGTGQGDPPPGDLLKVTSDSRRGAFFRVLPLADTGIGQLFASDASPFANQPVVTPYSFEAGKGQNVPLYPGWMFVFSFYVLG